MVRDERTTDGLTADEQTTTDARIIPNPARIMIIDGDQTIREVITEVLQEVGYATIQVTSTTHATQIIDELGPALRLVLLDPWQAEPESIQVARYLRDLGITAPIVVFTDFQDSARSLAEVGAVGILPRPFDIDRLIQIVGKFAPILA
jgi:DNA-binding NtrC family response regulator